MMVNPEGDGHEVSLTITNTGNRPGATVVQLYIGLSGESTPRPLRELKGFRRISLNHGEARRISFSLPSSSLLYWHPLKNCWVMPEGPIRIDAGLSERDIKQSVMLPTMATPLPSPQTFPAPHPPTVTNL